MIRFWSLVFSILLFATFAIADNSKVFEFTDTELNELKYLLVLEKLICRSATTNIKYSSCRKRIFL